MEAMTTRMESQKWPRQLYMRLRKLLLCILHVCTHIIHIYTYIHIYINIFIHIYIYTYLYIYIYKNR